MATNLYLILIMAAIFDHMYAVCVVNVILIRLEAIALRIEFIRVLRKQIF